MFPRTSLVEIARFVASEGQASSLQVIKKGRKGRRNRLKGARGRGTLEKEKPSGKAPKT